MAGAADPQPYSLTFESGDDGQLNDALHGSSQLEALRERRPTSPFALVTRARDDIGRLEIALRSFGYYDGGVAIAIEGRPLDDPDLIETLRALPEGQEAAVRIDVHPGVRYRLGKVAIEGPVPVSVQEALHLESGQPAIASDVLDARGRLLTALQEAGYALAEVEEPQAFQNPDDKTIDVTFKPHPGEKLAIGAIAITGQKAVNEAFIRRRLLVHQGEEYKPSSIEAARADLASLGVFSGVAARSQPDQVAGGEIPLVFDVAERPRHTLDLSAAYSTDLGGIPKVTWSDRNLFGNAEQLNLSAAATGLGGSATRGLGYNLSAQLIKPDFLQRDQQLEFNLGALKQSLDAYDQDAITGSTLLRRKLSRELSVNGGVSAETEDILQEGESRRYELLGLPLGASWDSTDLANPLLDPTHGMRAALSATPTLSLGHRQSTFVTMQASGSAYFDLARFGISEPERSVVAVRALVGSVQGATQFQLPPDQRFYGGGSGTVRGFKYQSVGPLFADGKPIGGTAIDAGAIEFRQRLYEDFGAAVFIDAGQVSESNAPFEGDLRVGAGTGVRYYTSIGALRLDVAVPVNAPKGGDSFELYIGLGQSF